MAVQQKVKKIKRISKERRSTMFTIDLDTKGMLIFLVLVLLTAITIFYLGVIFGKATRDPNDPALGPKLNVKKIVKDNKSISTKNLNIFNIRDSNDQDDSLKKKSAQVLKKSDRVFGVSDSAKQSKPKPAPAVAAKEIKAPSSKISEPQPQKEALFAVQIFATQNIARARDLIAQLRKKSFDAYIVEISVDGRKIYRVRVGKKTKNEAAKLRARLEKVMAGMGEKPKVYQID